MKAEAEALLIQRCVRGDEAAWNEVFDTHYDAVFRFLYGQSSDFTTEDAEELSQEVFLAAIQNISAFQSRSGLQTWLFRIAMNRGRDLIAKRRALKRGSGQQTLPLDPAGGRRGGRTIPALPAAPTPDPAEQASLADDFEQLRTALDRLGGPCRDLIELHYFGEVPIRALCIEFEMSVKSMRARLRKCLKRLEELLPMRFRVYTPARVPSNAENETNA
ncbi:MAG: RNA polymerase sigma factor [Verrucomicrobiae bacterium]|nr:RNA polymerase sigma factor [Verrucomicrobiae bacterium]MCP5520813.1 RNA polymerase sigma factor [Verrucomicrobiales bacterium]